MWTCYSSPLCIHSRCILGNRHRLPSFWRIQTLATLCSLGILGLYTSFLLALVMGRFCQPSKIFLHIHPRPRCSSPFVHLSEYTSSHSHHRAHSISRPWLQMNKNVKMVIYAGYDWPIVSGIRYQLLKVLEHLPDEAKIRIRRR